MRYLASEARAGAHHEQVQEARGEAGAEGGQEKVRLTGAAAHLLVQQQLVPRPLPELHVTKEKVEQGMLSEKLACRRPSFATPVFSQAVASNI